MKCSHCAIVFLGFRFKSNRTYRHLYLFPASPLLSSILHLWIEADEWLDELTLELPSFSFFPLLSKISLGYYLLLLLHQMLTPFYLVSRWTNIEPPSLFSNHFSMEESFLILPVPLLCKCLRLFWSLIKFYLWFLATGWPDRQISFEIFISFTSDHSSKYHRLIQSGLSFVVGGGF